MEILFFDETHEYLVDGVKYPSVTEVCKPLSSGYASINPSVLEMARNRGTAVHKATELIDKGYEVEQPEIDGYINAYINFLFDYQHPDWCMIEKVVFSKDGYCGTIDREGIIDGRHCIVDLKCIANPTKANKISVCCQTWAYQNALQIDCDRYALYLHDDGTYNLFDCKKYEYKNKFNPGELFKHCLEINKVMR